MKNLIEFFYLILALVIFAAAVTCFYAAYASQTRYLTDVKNQFTNDSVYEETELSYNENEIHEVSREELIGMLMVSPDENMVIKSGDYIIKVYSGRGIDNRIMIKHRVLGTKSFINFGEGRWDASRIKYDTGDGNAKGLSEILIGSDTYNAQEITDTKGNVKRIYFEGVQR